MVVEPLESTIKFLQPLHIRTCLLSLFFIQVQLNYQSEFLILLQNLKDFQMVLASKCMIVANVCRST